MGEKNDLTVEEKTVAEKTDQPSPGPAPAESGKKTGGKKWLIIGIAAAAVALIAVILILTSSLSPIKKFARALDDGDFAAAQQIYDENYYKGDFSGKAVEALEGYLASVQTDYVNDKIDLSAAEAAVNGVEQLTDIRGTQSAIQEISRSKRAAQAAKEACEQGDYYTALEQYEKIIPADEPNYANVDDYIAAAKKDLVSAALSDADAARKKSDYTGALQALQKVTSAGYGTEETSKAITETATAMVDSYTKKGDALGAYQELGKLKELKNDPEIKKLAEHTAALASQQILKEGQDLLAAGDYAGASKALSAATGELLTGEIKSEIDNCKAQYRQSVVESAEEAAAAGEYDKAESLLDGYLKQYSDKELEDRKADYHLKTLESQQLLTVERTSVNKGFIYSQATVVVKNNTDKVVKEYSVAMIMFDANGYPVNCEYSFDRYLGLDNVQAGRADSANIQPGATYGSGSYWSIDGGCRKILACVISAEFYDGTSWTNPYLIPWLDRYAGKPLT